VTRTIGGSVDIAASRSASLVAATTCSTSPEKRSRDNLWQLNRSWSRARAAARSHSSTSCRRSGTGRSLFTGPILAQRTPDHRARDRQSANISRLMHLVVGVFAASCCYARRPGEIDVAHVGVNSSPTAGMSLAIVPRAPISGSEPRTDSPLLSSYPEALQAGVVGSSPIVDNCAMAGRRSTQLSASVGHDLICEQIGLLRSHFPAPSPRMGCGWKGDGPMFADTQPKATLVSVQRSVSNGQNISGLCFD